MQKTRVTPFASQSLTALPLKYFHFAEVDAQYEVRRGAAQVAQYKGTVKWFNNAKGYGFLGREGGADVFVHYSSIQREGYKSLKEGDEVEFDIIQGTKGPQADQVARLKEVAP
jgi:cold shock protein